MKTFVSFALLILVTPSICLAEGASNQIDEMLAKAYICYTDVLLSHQAAIERWQYAKKIGKASSDDLKSIIDSELTCDENFRNCTYATREPRYPSFGYTNLGNVSLYFLPPHVSENQTMPKNNEQTFQHTFCRTNIPKPADLESLREVIISWDKTERRISY